MSILIEHDSEIEKLQKGIMRIAGEKRLLSAA